MISEPIFIHPSSEVHETATIGEGTKIWNWTKIRENASIGSNCKIGQCSYIDKDVNIGKNCKIQNGVSVYTGVIIGDDVLIGPNVTFTNDRHPRAHNKDWKILETIVEEGASIGANATIVCGVRLGKHCMIAAGAIVTKNVPSHALMAGLPARQIDYVTIMGKRLEWDMTKEPPSFQELKGVKEIC
jgi:UDP-2-acetamido-3-amino-2,3-dideoxy-glucuronate N-acetyltransferase